MRENKTQLNLSMVSLWVASIISIIACSNLNEAHFKDILKFGLLAVIFNAIFIYYLQIFAKKIIHPKFAWWLLGTGYLGSILLLCNPYEIGNYPFWLFGVALIAIYVDTSLSLIMTYSIIFMSIGLSLYQFDEMVIPLVLGTCVCLMSKFLTSVRNLVYQMILVLSMNVTLLFVMNEFNAKQVSNESNMLMLASDVAILLVLFIITRIFKVEKVEEIPPQESEIAITTEEIGCDENNDAEELSKNNKEQLEAQLIAAVAENAPLLELLHQESDKLFLHSSLVGTISKRAALEIGADENLACAGGWYHEIGRLKGKEYVQNGLDLLEEYHLPEVIGDMIRQHNYKVEMPQSMEAVIIMLTDNIVSTITYLKHNQDTKIGLEKVVENTFSILMNKGTFNEAKVDIAKFLKLKEFYLGMVNEIHERI